MIDFLIIIVTKFDPPFVAGKLWQSWISCIFKISNKEALVSDISISMTDVLFTSIFMKDIVHIKKVILIARC